MGVSSKGFLCYVLFCPHIPPLMLWVYLQTFEAALFLEEEEGMRHMDSKQKISFTIQAIVFILLYCIYNIYIIYIYINDNRVETRLCLLINFY